MGNAHPLPQEHYTYQDYASWTNGERYELVEGVPHLMSPAPLRIHQRVSIKLAIRFGVFLEGKPCELYVAPFDVRLNPDEGDDTVVQPDLVVICDPAKLNAQGCAGAPDLVIEILSPSSTRHDRFTKCNLYRKYGVREYWIVDPDARYVEVHILRDDHEYSHAVFDATETIAVKTLPSLEIKLAEIFES